MSSFIYIIEAENGMVKIGCSHSPEHRLGTIRCHSPVSVRLIAKWIGGTVQEKLLHADFADFRRHAEWFFVEGRLRDFIESERGVGLSEPIETWAETMHHMGHKDRTRAARIRSEKQKKLWENPEYRERHRVIRCNLLAARKGAAA